MRLQTLKSSQPIGRWSHLQTTIF